MADERSPAQSPTPAPDSKNDQNIAMLVWIGGIFFGFIPSLIVWLMNKDKPGFLTNQAKEALNFQITIILAFMASAILIVVLIGLFLMPVIGLLSLIFSIIGAVKASQGEDYRCPIALHLIK